jgi:NAD(P)-dependent dehydrogenase (short-subunit alcohol dehydrogenase family)
MADELGFEGKVVLITGAGRGLGRAHALLLAERGAAVVVNDLSTTMTGGPEAGHPAQETVELIRAIGGRAEADRNDVSAPQGAEALVAKAVDAFGHIDVVINNAGIYDLVEMPALSPDDVRRHLKTHVEGSFNVTHAAWSQLCESGSGRVMLMTSTGALGGANMIAYGTAKAALIGLGRALAQSGLEHGIKVNMVAPMAFTRMMAAYGAPGQNPGPEFEPSLVSPMVAVLAHESCPSTGEVYLAGMRRFARIVLAENRGYVAPSIRVAPEELVTHWEEIDRTDELFVMADTLTWVEAHQAFIDAVPSAGA